MLVVSRKPQEAIRIGDAVTVTIERISGGRVTLSIAAPSDLPILRTELLHGCESSAPPSRSQPPVQV